MAEYTIIVNDRTKLTKSLIDMALSISKLSKYVRVFDHTHEDKMLGKLMQESLETEKVSREEIMKALQK